jgi:ribosomal protein S18 acetylase RimI-like enzyme
MQTRLQEIREPAEVRACHSLMLQLRPQLGTADTWQARFQRQAADGYRLFALLREGQPLALAGFRLQENLVHGRFLYVDDLVTDASARGSHCGSQLMDALKAEAQRLQCALLVLDSALGNALAHRFYYRQGLLGQAMRFSLTITPQP